MNRRVPKRLNKEPLLEAVWEIRFDIDAGLPVGEMLPGILYQSLRNQYPKMVRLPAADIPRPIAQQDENLRYVPAFRLEGALGSAFAVQVGNRVVSLNNRRPYSGWPEFSSRIRELATLLSLTGLIQKPERFSLKYINLIDLDSPPSLASLTTSLHAAGHDLSMRPVQLRTEINDLPVIHILQVVSPVEVVIDGTDHRHGTLVDVDTIHQESSDFWSKLDERLIEAHEKSKRLFLLEMLTEDALARLDPVYD